MLFIVRPCFSLGASYANWSQGAGAGGCAQAHGPVRRWVREGRTSETAPEDDVVGIKHVFASGRLVREPEVLALACFGMNGVDWWDSVLGGDGERGYFGVKVS